MRLPVGTVTFLRTDIEGSMAHARALGARYDQLNAEHAELVRAVLAEHGGTVVRTEGDAFFAVFMEAGAAARAAVQIQRDVAAHPWPEGHALAVRIGLHTGAATRAGDDYGGFEVNRAARIAAAGWGSQIVLSDATRALVAAELPADWTLVDLGRHRLRGIAEPERLFGLVALGLRGEFPPLRSGLDATIRLPQPTSTFIGREAELEELAGLLTTTRLLTMTGPGGTGKTTLAAELARRAAPDFPDGAWFVDLATVHDTAAIAGETARSLRLLDGSTGTAADRLPAYLREREMLVVFDNFEQLVEGAPTVGALLAASPASRFLVTSRIPLRLREEQEYPVHPLRIGDDSEVATSEAVRLFVERVGRARPDLALDDQLDDVHAICRMLDGLPLAIELTAARAAVLPLQLMRSRLEQRLPLPGDGARDLPERQRTMERTVAWSYDLLEQPLQRLLARASVFEESFELEQAEQVCGPAEVLGLDVLGGLFELTRQSLLLRVDDTVGGVRFRMLETIRSFAAARLRESGHEAETRAAHARAYAALSRSEYGDTVTLGREHSLDRLAADLPNLRAATRYATSEKLAGPALDLVADWRFWLGAGFLREALAWTQAALELPDPGEQSGARARAFDACGSLQWWSGDVPAAGASYEEQLRVAEETGDEEQRARALFNIAHTTSVTEGPEAATATLDEAEAIFRRLGEQRWLVRLAGARSFATPGGQFDPERVPPLRDIIENLRGLDDTWARMTTLWSRAQIELIEGDQRAALRSIAAASRLSLRLREHGDLLVSLIPIATALFDAGEPEAAATIAGASAGAAERFGVGTPVDTAELTGGQDLESLLASILGSERYETLHAQGRRMSLEEALDALESIEPRLRPAHGA